MWRVEVNEGPAMSDDNAVYWTKEEPTFKAVLVPVNGEDLQPVRIVFIVFVPTNGASKGMDVRIPFGKVVSITDETVAKLEYKPFTHEAMQAANDELLA